MERQYSLYLPRDKGEKIVDQLTKKGVSWVAVRIKATIDSTRQTDGLQWNHMELLDVQFLVKDNKWSKWIVAEQQSAKQRI